MQEAKIALPCTGGAFLWLIKVPIISEQIYDGNKKKECVLTINIIGSGRVGAAGKAHQHQGGGALVHAVLVVLVRGASVAAAWTPFA